MYRDMKRDFLFMYMLREKNQYMIVLFSLDEIFTVTRYLNLFLVS